MSDVRALLRNERASRRITHPDASYSATGKLTCAVCGLSLQSDQDVWQAHLRSTQHAMRAERLRISQLPSRASRTEQKTQSSTSASIPQTRKRKASEPDEQDESRKRNKPIEVPRSPSRLNLENPEDRNSALPPQSPDPVKASAPPAALSHAAMIDEAEWAAFQRDVATPPPSSPLTNANVISAAPVSAEELAEQEALKAKEEGRERPDQEMEDEKEDAARILEEEFDAMDGLESRLKKLREKRDELRQLEEARSSAPEGGGGPDDVANGEEESDEEEEEDLDSWGFVR